MHQKLRILFSKDNYHILSSLIIAGLIFTFTSIDFFRIKALDSLGNKILDLNFTRRGTIKPVDSLDVIIIGITKETINELPAPYNQWPLPRNIFAKAIKNLNKAGIKVIGIDLLFSEPDRYLELNDSLLVDALKEKKNVILAGKLEQLDWRYKVEQMENYNVGNIFFGIDSSIGIVNVLLDDDGVLRKYFPYFYDVNINKKLPSFSLAVINSFYNLDKFFTPIKEGRYFNYGFFSIPEYTPNSFLINYYGPEGTFRQINLIDIIDDKDFQTAIELDTGEEINTFDDSLTGLLYSNIFRNKVALIGSIEPEDKDLFPVSISPVDEGSVAGNLMYGVEVHANVVQMVLDKNFLKRESRFVRFVLIVFLVLVCLNLFEKIRTTKMKYDVLAEILNIFLVAAFLFILYNIGFYLFTNQNIVLMLVPPSVAIITSYVVSATVNFLKERKQKLMIKGMFSQYLNPKLVEELIEHPENLKLGGVRKEMSVLFSDLMNFTTVSEKINPETLVELLNEYFDSMTEIIFETKGTLDKFEGDGIMAFWGAPIDDPEHNFNSALCSLKMKRKVDELKKYWKTLTGIDVKVRIGINSGEMIVGNMGGKKKFDYTVMGDSVNLAARLEATNKTYGTDIIISENVYDKIKDRVIARELDLILVKGKTVPVRIYQLIDLKDNPILKPELLSDIKAVINYFESGLKHYREKRFDKAIEEFEKALLIDPEDFPSKVFIDRCLEFLSSPPDEDWNGVFESKVK